MNDATPRQFFMEGTDEHVRRAEHALQYARNFSGRLSDETIQRLIRLVRRPNVDNWEDAHGITLRVKPHLTLWQAVMAIDPSFPNHGRSTEPGTERILREWERLPIPKTVVKAIEFACQQDKENPND